MPNWNQLLNELQQSVAIQDTIRRRYAHEIHEVTGRNVILYFSGWLQKGKFGDLGITDEDKNGFMTVIHELDDRSLGLDLVLHTPGGEVAATESLVDYLRSMFGGDVRAIIPQLAMSAGTMIACAATEIVMGKQSSLGPIDPQLNGIPAHGVIEEFENARLEIIENPSTVPVWQPIISRYPPAFLGECRKAMGVIYLRTTHAEHVDYDVPDSLGHGRTYSVSSLLSPSRRPTASNRTGVLSPADSTP